MDIRIPLKDEKAGTDPLNIIWIVYDKFLSKG